MWENNIKDTGFDSADWIRLAQDSAQQQAFTNTVMNF